MNYSKYLWLLSLFSYIELLNSGLTHANELSTNSADAQASKLKNCPLTKISFSEPKILLESQLSIELSPHNYSQLVSQFVDRRNPPPKSNFYFGGGVGLFFPNVSGSVSSTGGENPGTGSLNIVTNSNVGYNALAGLKTSFGRAELELLANNNSIERLDFSSNGRSTRFPAKGDLFNAAVMLTGYYDIATGTQFTPYIGGGIGYGYNRATITNTVNNRIVTDIQSGSGLAYQLKIGAAYTVSDRTDIYLQYRYLNNPSITSSVAGGGSTVTGTLNSSSSSIEIGTRYAF